MKREPPSTARRSDELVERIREGIERRERSRPPRAGGLRAGKSLRELDTMRFSEELGHLNRNWQIAPRVEVSSHRPVVGRAIVAVKRRLAGSVVGSLGGYFRSLQDFLSNVVRFLNSVVEHLERLVEAARRDDETLVSRTEAFLERMLESERRLEAEVDGLREEIARLRSDASPAALPPPPSGAQSVGAAPPAADETRLAFYVPALLDAAPVLHVLAGRGTLVAALREAGVEAVGCEPDAALVSIARGADRAVALSPPAVAARDGGWGAVVVSDSERLEPAALVALLAEARERLREGGVVVVEAPNPAAHAGLARLVAVRGAALAPEALRHAIESAGFEDVRGDLLAMDPAPLPLPDVELVSPTLRLFAANFRRLSETLLAPARHYAIGRRGAGRGGP